MSHRGPVRVHERHAFDTLIDARSPAEFELDHLPGAINCPVLDDEERRIVGTLYKQQGAFEARRVGGATKAGAQQVLTPMPKMVPRCLACAPAPATRAAVRSWSATTRASSSSPHSYVSRRSTCAPRK